MWSFRKTLFIPIVVVVCFSLAALVARPAYAATIPAASVHTASPHTHTQPFTSGGGCLSSADGRVSACISVTSSRVVLPDAYISCSPSATYVSIVLHDDTSNTSQPAYFTSGGCGHLVGWGMADTANHLYETEVYACFNGPCEQQPSKGQIG